MPTLQPASLLASGNHLWAVDAVQPVAAMIDPAGVEAPHVVTWKTLPPAPVGEVKWSRSGFAYGDCLYVQEHRGGPVARLGRGGIEQVWWVDDSARLVAAGPDGAWVAPPPPEQRIVTRAEAVAMGAPEDRADGAIVEVDSRALPPGLTGQALHRLEDDGVTKVEVMGDIVEVIASSDGLEVEVARLGGRGTARLRDLGMGEDFDAEFLTQWVALSWHAEQATLDEQHVIDEGRRPSGEEEGYVMPWLRRYDSWQEPLVVGDLHWRAGQFSGEIEKLGDIKTDSEEHDADHTFGWFAYAPLSGEYLGDVPDEYIDGGWTIEDPPAGGIVDDEVPPPDEPGAGEPGKLVVTAHDAEGKLVQRWVLGEGEVSARAALENALVIAVTDASSMRIVLLRAGSDAVRQLADDIDITAAVRPLVTRPVEEMSYVQQMLARHPAPAWADIEDEQTRLVGEWPASCIEWTFTHAARPGLRLCRRLDLFDHIGRILGDELGSPLDLADIHLMEDLGTGAIPPASQAVGGLLIM